MGKPLPALVSYKVISSNYTLTNIDYTIECSANTFTVTLPDATTIFTIPGRTYTICNTGSGSITLSATNLQTINGLTTQTIQARGGPARGFSTCIIQSTGFNWLIISASLP
jgi:hypothetical protein